MLLVNQFFEKMLLPINHLASLRQKEKQHLKSHHEDIENQPLVLSFQTNLNAFILPSLQFGNMNAVIKSLQKCPSPSQV